MKQIFKLKGILPGAILACLLMLGMNPVSANTCQATCTKIYNCTLLIQSADTATVNRVKRNKAKVIQNCVKGCKKNTSAAIGCYRKSGPAVNIASCQSVYSCMLPYLQQAQ